MARHNMFISLKRAMLIWRALTVALAHDTDVSRKAEYEACAKDFEHLIEQLKQKEALNE